MAKICCFAQRQDGSVIGLVKLDSENKPDLTTASLIVADFPPDADGSSLTSNLLLEKTGIRTDWSFPLYTHTDSASGEEIHVFDMNIKRTYRPASKDPAFVVLWINPWHLINGPHGEIARAVFDFNGTHIRQPVVYKMRTNDGFVTE